MPKTFKNVEKLKYTIENKFSTFLPDKIPYLEFNAIQSSKEKILLKVTIAEKIKKIKTRIVKKLFLIFQKIKTLDFLKKEFSFFNWVITA